MPSVEQFKGFLTEKLSSGFLLEPEAWDAKVEHNPPTRIGLSKEDSWHVLCSAYSTLVDARELSGQLPSTLHRAPPWMRPLLRCST